MSPHPLIIVGPTASGKTGLAHALARRNGMRILSADAMMVYRGMDIGTAKPSPAEIREFHYAGIDLVNPDQPFNAHAYRQAVAPALAVDHAGARPLLVAGGTGLYLRALLYGLDSASGADHSLREEALALLDASGFDRLKEWCRARMPGIEARLPPGDLGNPRRWIRMVERGGRRPAEAAPPVPAPARIIGLRRTREDLEQRIRHRVAGMFAGGLLEEVARLRQNYVILSETAAKAIGYAEAMAVLDGTMQLGEAMEKTAVRTRQYAKRQMTWFRHQLAVEWIEVAPGEEGADVAGRLRR